MRQTFIPFDDLLIERVFQPVSNIISDRLRGNRMMAARGCIDIATACWILSFASQLSGTARWWDASVALSGVMVLTGLVALCSLRLLFSRVQGAARASPLRAAMMPHRACVLLLLSGRLITLGAAGLPEFADLLMLVFVTTALYLAACGEPPRVRRRTDALVRAGAG
ncbi:MAG: hypothetical protein AB7F35_19820 [Acetobacteraceae bacterium]